MTTLLNATTTAYAASLVVATGQAKLFGVKGHNSGAAQFVQIHDAATLPADGAAPRVLLKVGAATSFEIPYDPENPREFTIGIVICNSSTGPTKTIGAADLWLDAQYK